jgi:cardiolipin synthase (CMP-forming)
MRHLPNIICLVRIALIWPILAGLLAGRFELTLALFLVAAASDGLDGWLAKHFGWQSRLGRVLDPAADKLLLVAVFLMLTWMGLVPRWLAVAAIARDFMIALGAVTFIAAFGPLRGRPIRSSKLNTLLQLIYVLAVVVHAAFGIPPASVLQALAAATLVTVVVSGWAYLREFTVRALLPPTARRA